ncbi:MAG: hypothetical protein KKB37_10990 [Alphaproteobacteria bacterium]|nr:hypothetical protein [Alphaproteobacteria bacterium]
MTNSKGKQVELSCNNSGCYVNNRRVGEGGSSNFGKLVRQYKRQGYK